MEWQYFMIVPRFKSKPEKVETEWLRFVVKNTYQMEVRLVETAVKAEVLFLKSIQDLEPY